jgi:hypothetical protein
MVKLMLDGRKEGVVAENVSHNLSAAMAPCGLWTVSDVEYATGATAAAVMTWT